MERAPHRHQTLIITATYTAAWFLMLLNGGRYWDDWVLLRLSKGGAALMADMLGQWWQRYYWQALSWWHGAEYVFHVLTFALFLAAALLLNRILRRVPKLDGLACVVVPVLFGVFPVNAARYVHINLQYTASVAAFCLAWYLVAIDLEHPRLLLKVISAVVFAAALFTTNSLLTFILLVPLFILWARWDELRSKEVRQRLLLRYSFLLVLPFLVWLYRNWAWRPWGLYETYNMISRRTLVWALRESPRAVWASLISPSLAAVRWLPLAVPIYFALSRRDKSRIELSVEPLAVLGFGVLAFSLAVIPYLVVGKLPQARGFAWDVWDSRHQVLVPLGAALIIYGITMSAGALFRLRRAIVMAVLASLIVGFVAANIRVGMDYQADWYKQVALMDSMRDSPDFREGNTFVVRDEATELNVVRRRYLPYELSGMMFRVFGQPIRFGVDEQLIPSYASQLRGFGKYEQYHWNKYQPPPRAYLVEIRPGSLNLRNRLTLLELMWCERFQPDEFEKRVREVISVETTTWAGATS